MPEPESTSTSADVDARLIADVIALRAIATSVIKQAERLLENHGVSVESAVVTRRERRGVIRRTKR